MPDARKGLLLENDCTFITAEWRLFPFKNGATLAFAFLPGCKAYIALRDVTSEIEILFFKRLISKRERLTSVIIMNDVTMDNQRSERNSILSSSFN